jgi:predicted RND superfamily exporter protein
MPYQQAPARNPHSTSVSVRPYGGAPISQARPRPSGQMQPQRPQARAIPVKKRRRKERDYFFIMRRGVCFLLLLFSLIWIAVIALNYLNILPNFTSFVIEKDLTPLDERLEIDTGEVDGDGNAIMQAYADKSVYVSMMDPLYGGIAAILKKPMVDANGVSLSPFYDEIYNKIMNIPPEGEVDPEAIDPDARAADSMMMIAQIAFP